MTRFPEPRSGAERATFHLADHPLENRLVPVSQQTGSSHELSFAGSPLAGRNAGSTALLGRPPLIVSWNLPLLRNGELVMQPCGAPTLRLLEDAHQATLVNISAVNPQPKLTLPQSESEKVLLSLDQHISPIGADLEPDRSPTLIVLRKKDATLSPHLATESLKLSDNDWIEWLLLGTHCLHYEEPMKINNALMSFLTQYIIGNQAFIYQAARAFFDYCTQSPRVIQYNHLELA